MMSQHSSLRRIGPILAALIVLAVAIASPAKPAAAAWGNVQLAVNSNITITRMQVSGWNQSGNWAVWGPNNTNSTWVGTSNWWWSSSYAYIKLHLSNGSAYDCFVPFPNNFWDNWETLQFDGRTGQGSVWGAPSTRCARIYNF